MKINSLDKISIILLFLILIVPTILYTKDKDDKDKDKEEKIKDEKIKDDDSILENFNESIIKSDIIYRETMKNPNDMIKDNVKINFERNIKKSKVRYIFESLDTLQENTDEIKKDIKITTTGSINAIKEKYKKTRDIITDIDIESEKLFDILNKDEETLILQQKDIIKKSQKKLSKLLNSIESDLDKKTDQEILFNKTKDLEKEVKIITRQYRAINWILFEQ